MTLLVSWIGVDNRKISSVYISSDSRISWNKKDNFDQARKVFAFKNSPDIMGYCGDVLFPSLILNQILEMDKENILFTPDITNKDRANKIFNEIKIEFKNYPSHLMCPSIEIIHISRDDISDFRCYIYKWSNKSKWQKKEIELPSSSDKITSLGSGKREFNIKYKKYQKANSCKTSRSIFQSICKCLIDIKDFACGGAPQLVGMYNKGNGINFGTIYNNKLYFLGKEIKYSSCLSRIEWRNKLFERCNPSTLKIFDNAQQQPDDLSNK